MEYNIENKEGILIQGKGNYCLKLQKQKLKTKKLLKITNIRYIGGTRALSTITRTSLKLRKYVFTIQNMESGCQSFYIIYLKTNSGFHAGKNPKQHYLKVVTFGDPSFSIPHFILHLC